MKRILVGLCAVAALLSFGGAASAQNVKVGLIAPFSGGFAIWGQQFQRAVQAYQKVHGDSVKGTKVEVLYRDVGGADPAKSKQLAEELILRERIKYLTGFAFTPNALAVADVVTEARVPTVIMNAATAVITRRSPMYVRVSMTLPQQTAPLAKWAHAKGYKKIYTLVSDYGPGHDAEGTFVKTFKAAGGAIVESVRVPLATTDFAPFLENVLRAKPDALFLFMPAGPPSIGAINTWAKRGLKAAGIPLLVTGETQEIYLPAIGEGALDVISSNHYGTEVNTPENAALKKTLADMFGKDSIPDIASVAAWDGMSLIYEAIGALGPNADGAKVIDFMKGRKLKSPRGPIEIDANTRDIIQNMYIRKVVKKGAMLVNETVDTIPMVKDPWKEENPEKK
jgi:branched-chain amino acid transport system substrate-binding protein